MQLVRVRNVISSKIRLPRTVLSFPQLGTCRKTSLPSRSCTRYKHPYFWDTSANVGDSEIVVRCSCGCTASIRSSPAWSIDKTTFTFRRLCSEHLIVLLWCHSGCCHLCLSRRDHSAFSSMDKNSYRCPLHLFRTLGQALWWRKCTFASPIFEHYSNANF